MDRRFSARADLSTLAMGAATELDALVEPTQSESVEAMRALAEELRSIFPADKRPDLPPDTIGLVCGVVQNWSNEPTERGYSQSAQLARDIAERLESAAHSQGDIQKLIKFCVSLFYATQRRSVIHDGPTDHPDFLSMC